jgi:hypothetical protein
MNFGKRDLPRRFAPADFGRANNGAIWRVH